MHPALRRRTRLLCSGTRVPRHPCCALKIEPVIKCSYFFVLRVLSEHSSPQQLGSSPPSGRYAQAMKRAVHELGGDGSCAHPVRRAKTVELGTTKHSFAGRCDQYASY